MLSIDMALVYNYVLLLGLRFCDLCRALSSSTCHFFDGSEENEETVHADAARRATQQAVADRREHLNKDGHSGGSRNRAAQ